MTVVRSDEEAWEIAEDNKALGPALVEKYLGDGIRLSHNKYVYKAPAWVWSQGIDTQELREDLEAVAVMATFRAAKSWDEDKGAFSTLAAYPIAQDLHQEIENHRRVNRQEPPKKPDPKSSGQASVD